MAEILKIESKKKCYLLHDDILIVGIPFAKMQEAVAALKDGKTDSKSLWANCVFILDDTFTMTHDPNIDVLVLQQGKKRFTEDAPELEDIYNWLVKNLKTRHYLPHNERADKSKNLGFAFFTALVLAVITGSLAYLKFAGILPALNPQSRLAEVIAPFYNTGTIIVIGVILIIITQIIFLAGNLRKNKYKTVYCKKDTQYKTITADVYNKQSKQNQANTRKSNGHYIFAHK